MNYGIIINELNRCFDIYARCKDKAKFKVLEPGCGLARLTYEIYKEGYNIQANEDSIYMLMGINLIFNHCSKSDEYHIQPLIHSHTTLFWHDSQFQVFSIPDECPRNSLNCPNDSDRITIIPGEFSETYRNQIEQFDSCVTSYFLDTATNIIEYVEIIYNALKEEGFWINFGPLLYHYTKLTDECSIELSWDELKYIIEGYGFQILVYM